MHDPRRHHRPIPGPARRTPTRSARGATLIELVIAIVVFAAAGAGILSVYIQTTADSVDPQIRAQGRAIAEAYMDEILLQRYCEDPEPPNPCDTQEDSGGGAEEANRADFDDVFDYKAINNENPTDQTGNGIGQLDDYTVDVTVAGDPQAEETAEITVNVRHATGKLDYDLVSERELY